MENKLYSMAHTKMKELQDHGMSWIEVRVMGGGRGLEGGRGLVESGGGGLVEGGRGLVWEDMGSGIRSRGLGTRSFHCCPCTHCLLMLCQTSNH